MQAEYDFSRGVRGNHFRRYHRGTNVVVLAPDVARVFFQCGNRERFTPRAGGHHAPPKSRGEIINTARNPENVN